MNITVYGATGQVGQRIVREALMRGHSVTAIGRSQASLNALPKEAVTAVADVSDRARITSLVSGQDLVISALRPPAGREAQLVELTRHILEVAAATGVRLLMVGGAARLRIPGRDGATVLTAPNFLPDSAVAIARACQAQYNLCLQDENADWSYLSPPAMLLPGKRTGHYRVGLDTLVTNERGVSEISMEDFAIALLDEAEAPRHQRRGFTVGY